MLKSCAQHASGTYIAGGSFSCFGTFSIFGSLILACPPSAVSIGGLALVSRDIVADGLSEDGELYEGIPTSQRGCVKLSVSC